MSLKQLSARARLTLAMALTGRIGAGNNKREAHWWCPGGAQAVLEVPSGVVGAICIQPNVGLREDPCFEQLADFPYMHVYGNGANPFHVTRRTFGGQVELKGQQAMHLWLVC